MLMTKDGLTREVESCQGEMFKNLGFTEVKEVEKQAEDSKQAKKRKSEED